MGSSLSVPGPGSGGGVKDLLGEFSPQTCIPLLPWSASVELLSLIIRDKRRTGYLLLGPLHKFVSADFAQILEGKLSKRSPSRTRGKRLEKRIDQMQGNLVKRFVTGGPQAEAQVTALLNSEASFKLIIDNRFLENIEDVSDLLRGMELDLSQTSTPLQELLRSGPVTCYVVDQMYQATAVLLELGGSSTAADFGSKGIALEGGLELCQVTGRTGVLRIRGMGSDQENPVPFSLAIGCCELVFGKDGKLQTQRSPSTIQPAGENVKYTFPTLPPFPRRAKLVEEKGGYINLESRASRQQVLAAVTTAMPAALEESNDQSTEMVLGKRKTESEKGEFGSPNDGPSPKKMPLPDFKGFGRSTSSSLDQRMAAGKQAVGDPPVSTASHETLAPAIETRRYWLSTFRAIPQPVQQAIAQRKGREDIVNIPVYVTAHVSNLECWLDLREKASDKPIVKRGSKITDLGVDKVLVGGLIFAGQLDYVKKRCKEVTSLTFSRGLYTGGEESARISVTTLRPPSVVNDDVAQRKTTEESSCNEAQDGGQVGVEEAQGKDSQLEEVLGSDGEEDEEEEHEDEDEDEEGEEVEEEEGANGGASLWQEMEMLARIVGLV